MSSLRKRLPRRAWLRIYRMTGLLVAVAVALSVILTNVMMELYSAGINVQGLIVAIVMPLLLGGPMTLLLVTRQEQLRHANAQLEHLASTDWLTACLNRGAFTVAVTSHLARRNAKKAGALLIVDADDFKSVNDRFGHDAGDEALRLIAEAIRTAVRDSDLVGRLGGEEFGVLITDAEAQVADQLAERIRSAIAAIAFAPGGTPCPLSVSIGGATYSGNAQFRDLYRTADQRLYDAKSTGRDRVAMQQAA